MLNDKTLGPCSHRDHARLANLVTGKKATTSRRQAGSDHTLMILFTNRPDQDILLRPSLCNLGQDAELFRLCQVEQNYDPRLRRVSASSSLTDLVAVPMPSASLETLGGSVLRLASSSSASLSTAQVRFKLGCQADGSRRPVRYCPLLVVVEDGHFDLASVSTESSSKVGCRVSRS
jgi:hypothetical protein